MKQKIWRKRGRGLLAAIAAEGLIMLLSGCGAAPPQKQTLVDTAMGTIVSQTLYIRHGEETQTETAAVMQLLAELEQQELSWRTAGSEVARINAQVLEAAKEEQGIGGAEKASITVSISPSMYGLLSRIWHVSKDSGGAMDVTLGRLSRLWNLDELAALAENESEQINIPTPEEVQGVLADCGYEKVQLSDETIALPAGMQLDLGAVGKGIACDRIREYLSSQPQITGAVVAVGGSVVTYGEKPDGSPWQVAVMHPREEGTYLGILSLTGEQYISTSGDYERYVMTDGVRYHHILDPATGYPVRSGLCSVTVVCDSGLLADALSTACFVLGPEQGLTLAEDYGAEALLVEEDGTLHMTEGMKEIFSAGQSWMRELY